MNTRTDPEHEIRSVILKNGGGAPRFPLLEQLPGGTDIA
jgi:hypothetical protein